MKKTTKRKAVQVYGAISRKDFTLSKVNGAAKIAFVRCAATLKRVADNYNAYLVEAYERLRPTDFAEIAIKIREGVALTKEESMTAAKYEADMEECMRPENDSMVELDYQPLDTEALSAVFESNPNLSVSEILALTEVLGKEDSDAV